MLQFGKTLHRPSHKREGILKRSKLKLAIKLRAFAGLAPGISDTEIVHSVRACNADSSSRSVSSLMTSMGFGYRTDLVDNRLNPNSTSLSKSAERSASQRC